MPDRLVNVIPIDPVDPVTGLLLPAFTQRALGFAREHVTHTSPEKLVRELIAGAMLGNLDVLLLGFVTEDYRLVGHAVSTVQSNGEDKWVYTYQCKADENVGDAVRRAIELVDLWGKTRGATHMVMTTHRMDAAWARKYGFKTTRHTMERELGQTGVLSE